MIRAWHIVGLLLAVSLAGGACGDDGEGAGGDGGTGGTGGTGGSGTNFCPDLIDCAVACQSDSTCIQNCLDKGTQVSQTKVGAFLQCTQDYSCQNQSCVSDNCAGPSAVCGDDMGDALLNCVQISACIGLCNGPNATDPQDCNNACGAAATESAVELWNDFVACVGDQCPDLTGTELTECYQTNCADEVAACEGR